MSTTNNEFDILVAGFGMAGASAAITAHDAGARVLVVEKTSAGGGNCRHSGGFLYAIDGPAAIDHLDAVCFERTDRSVLEAYAEGSREIVGWIEELGGSAPLCPPAIFSCPWPHFPGPAECIYRQFDGNGQKPGLAFWDFMEQAVRSRGIEIALDTAVADLVIEDGAVRGAVLQTGDTQRTITADAVILANGGIEYDPELRDSYLPLPVSPIGHPGNTGDSIRLAQRAGASLWHMPAFFGWLAYTRPEFPSAFGININAPSYLLVDEDGRRFADETGRVGARDWSSFSPSRASRPRARGFVIFDEAARLEGPLNGIGGTPNDYDWSRDNSAEVEAGWITRAETPNELAQKIGVDPSVLASTLETFAEAAATGNDAEFNRPPETLAPLAGPLYAIPVVPGLATASGGPRRDARARVLRSDGGPVPGLYAVGGAGSIWGGPVTEQGGGLSDAIVFGRIAGADASHLTAGVSAESAVD